MSLLLHGGDGSSDTTSSASDGSDSDSDNSDDSGSATTKHSRNSSDGSSSNWGSRPDSPALSTASMVSCAEHNHDAGGNVVTAPARVRVRSRSPPSHAPGALVSQPRSPRRPASSGLPARQGVGDDAGKGGGDAANTGSGDSHAAGASSMSSDSEESWHAAAHVARAVRASPPSPVRESPPPLALRRMRSTRETRRAPGGLVAVAPAGPSLMRRLSAGMRGLAQRLGLRSPSPPPASPPTRATTHTAPPTSGLYDGPQAGDVLRSVGSDQRGPHQSRERQVAAELVAMALEEVERVLGGTDPHVRWLVSGADTLYRCVRVLW